MIITPHALAGALAATRSPNIVAGLTAATKSHMILDKIPHRDYSIEGRRGALSVTVDAIAALVLLRACGVKETKSMLGAAAGVAPDVLALAWRKNLIPEGTPGVEDAVSFHDSNHSDRDVGPEVGWAIQVVLTIVLAILLRQSIKK